MNKQLLSGLMLSLFLFSSCAKQVALDDSHAPIIILHTNDVHAGIDDHIGYAGLAAYKKKMEDQYGEKNVILVDAGDYLQGASVAMLTQGEAIVELMNAVGYDYVTLGNHEFDYQIPRLFELSEVLDSKIISSNFISLENNKAVYSQYEIYTINGIDIAFVGVTTPESLTKASTQYFQNSKGELIYTFLEGSTGQKFYEDIQKSVNAAISDGAEYVVGVVHLGVDEASKPWRSLDLLANVSGFDVLLDGHSHSVIEGEVYKDKKGDAVILSQTGTKLKYIGKVTIDPTKSDGKDIQAELVHKDESTAKDAMVQAKIDEINTEFKELLSKIVAQSDFNLLAGEGDESIVRIEETNLGNLVADAYRVILDTDIAIANGGGIRTSLNKGEITYKEIIDIHPFGNHIMSMEISGKTLKNALEMGAKNFPGPDGGFLQPSGFTYDIDASIPSSVKLDEYGNFLMVDGAYRVKNIKINGQNLDENKLYSVACNDFTLKKSGDGMAMFKGSKILKDMFMADSEVLIKYIVENLNGRIGKEYANPKGSKRINIL